jgi:hypothetical protein
MPERREIDWDAEAVAMAVYVGDHLFSAHRGAMPWRQVGISVVFGNDGYRYDLRTKEEVETVRGVFKARGIKVLGFGVEPEEGYSWAMLVDSDDAPTLNAIVWVAWMADAEPEAVQSAFDWWQTEEVKRAIREAGPKPDHSAN